ncbi:unnamed protein product [Victoria cruziana]
MESLTFFSPSFSSHIFKPSVKGLCFSFAKFPLHVAGRRQLSDSFRRSAGGGSSDEYPVDDSYLEKFKPRNKETEDEARRRNWIERGWAPWEEILTPEADFARKSLDEGEEVPLETPEAIEAFRMLSPKFRKKKMDESGLSDDEWLSKQFEIKGEIPDPLKTAWNGPLVLLKIPPRDWPPPGWRVNKRELEFIREAHKLQSLRIDPENVEAAIEAQDASFARYEVFLKQYKIWVDANRERLEDESYEEDQDYYPGRRKKGKDYNENMYELPFLYPGQICAGKVSSIHLYQGAFVDIGCVHDGWVPIKGNDWYWIRHHIKVGMNVIVEILAKRDPYRYRFPIELRFVNPNIDHLIFNRFDFSPIFHRDEDTNPDALLRDSGRPPMPRRRQLEKIEDQPLLSDHPYVDKIWQLHVSEQMILDDEEEHPDKYRNNDDVPELMDADSANDEETIEYTQRYFKKALLPHVIMKTNVKELDMESARAERQLNNKLKKEAEERGEEFKVTKLRRNIEMDEYDFIHWQRSLEEREALIRDISCRRALGLPLEEPERYKDDSYFGKDRYDPSNPLYRYDYWGEPKNSEKSKQERETDIHNKSIIGKGTVWYEMSYEDAIKQQMQRQAGARKMNEDDEQEEEHSNSGNSSSRSQPIVNGTESTHMSDEGLFGK